MTLGHKTIVILLFWVEVMTTDSDNLQCFSTSLIKSHRNRGGNVGFHSQELLILPIK